MTKQTKSQHPPVMGAREEIVNINAMFHTLRRSYDSLPNRTGIEESSIEFAGFDGGNESEHLNIARELAAHDHETAVPESPTPVLLRYRNMLIQWNASTNRSHLTREDILRITTPPLSNL